MRVLFCSQAAHTGGGVEAWMEALTAALLQNGAEVFTGLARGRFHDPDRYQARHRVSNPIEIDGRLGFREVRISNLVRLFRQVEPDVIIPANLSDAILAGSYWKTRGGRARMVTCLHTQDDQQVEQLRANATFIDLFTSVSKRVTNQLVLLTGEPERVRHLPTGVPEPVAPFIARECIRNVAYIGRLDQSDKRVLDSIEFMKQLEGSGVRLHIIGSGAEDGRLRSALAPYPVEFHGELTRQQLYESIYPAIDAIVIFSEAEAGPIVAWEALIHGVVPVVSNFVGRADEGVMHDDANSLVFAVGDVAGAAARIRKYSSAGLAPLSRAARTALPIAYTLAGFATSWQTELEECMSKPLRKGHASQLPALSSTGRMAKLRFSVEQLAWLRRLCNDSYQHHEPGSEWPH